MSHCVGMASRGRSKSLISFTISPLLEALLGLLESFDELRQCADCAILGHAIFTANLALHFAFAEESAPASIQRKTASCCGDGAFG